MAIQHKDIGEENLHEPKGVSVAPGSTVYIADGLGSGNWGKLSTGSLQGLESATAGHRLLVGPGGSITSKADFSTGSMAIVDNTNGFSVTAAASSNLQNTSDYKLFTGNGAPWTAGSVLEGVSFSTNRLLANTTGIFRIDICSTISEFPASSSAIGMKYCINGVEFSEATSKTGGSSSDVRSINMFGIVSLNSSDYIQVYLASTHTGTVTVSSMDVALTLIKAS